MSVAVEQETVVQRPTRVRFRVVGLVMLLGGITYLDRVCIASLAPYIMDDLSLSHMQMSMVFSSFTLAYMLFEIPTAWYADRVGTRKVLTRIVVWWSSFTIATAGAFNYASLLVGRFLFGAGEAGAWPTIARTLSQWVPYRERGIAQGTFFVGAHIGGGITPLLVAILLGYLHWRMIFVVFGLVGFLWALYWYYWFRDEPAMHPQANESEVQYILADRRPEQRHAVGWEYWSTLVRNPNMWAICLMYIPNSFGFYFCISWLPRYLSEEHGLSEMWLALFAGLPLVLSVIADVAGGLLTDWAARRYGRRFGRAGVGFVSYGVAGAIMVIAAFVTNPVVAGLLIAMSTATSMLMLATAWATCQDVGGNHTGVVGATMNTAGQIGGIACPILVTLLVETYHEWSGVLIMIGALFFFGAICWCFIDPRRPIFGDDSQSEIQS